MIAVRNSNGTYTTGTVTDRIIGSNGSVNEYITITNLGSTAGTGLGGGSGTTTVGNELPNVETGIYKPVYSSNLTSFIQSNLVYIIIIAIIIIGVFLYFHRR